MNRISLMPVPLMLLLLSACATQPMEDDRLQQAQQAVSEAEENAAVARYAPLALRDAQETLRQAQQLARQNAEPEVVEHYAYLAQKRAEIAQSLARREMLVHSTEDVQQQRAQIMLEARERAAEQARQQAEQAHAEAERLRREAQQERERAQLSQHELEQARQQAQLSQQELQEAREQAQLSQQALQEAQRQLADLKPKQTERGLVLTLDEVLFPFNSADLQAGNQRALDRLAQYLEAQPDASILIEGHTDSVGDTGYNQRLSERRAESVYQALTQRGIDPSRVRIAGLGESFPVADNETPQGRAQNRRVEVVVAQGDTPASRQEMQQARRGRPAERERTPEPRG